MPYQLTKNQTLFPWIAVHSLRSVDVAFSTTGKHVEELFVAYFNVFKKLLFILSAFRVGIVAATGKTVVPVVDKLK